MKSETFWQSDTTVTVKTKEESLIEGTYDEIWPEEYFVAERISLNGKGADYQATFAVNPIDRVFHELLVTKGEVRVNIEGEDIVLKAGSSLFIPAAIKTLYTISAKGESEVLKFYKPVGLKDAAIRSQERIISAAKEKGEYIPMGRSSSHEGYLSWIERGKETTEPWDYFKKNGSRIDALALANKSRVNLEGRSIEVLQAAYNALSMLYTSYFNAKDISEYKDEIILFLGNDVLNNQPGFKRALEQLGKNQVPVVIAKDENQKYIILGTFKTYDFQVMTLKEANLEGIDFNKVMNEESYGIEDITNLRFMLLRDVIDKHPTQGIAIQSAV